MLFYKLISNQYFDQHSHALLEITCTPRFTDIIGNYVPSFYCHSHSRVILCSAPKLLEQTSAWSTPLQTPLQDKTCQTAEVVLFN